MLTRRAVLHGALAGGLVAFLEGSQSPISLLIDGVASAAPRKLGLAGLRDEGVVVRHGDGPDECDQLGAREAIAFTDGQRLFMHYDGVGPNGWLACLASSSDGRTWTKHGPVLTLGAPGRPDSASASSAWVFPYDGTWFMHYLGTPYAGLPPGRTPFPPYFTLLAESSSPTGPWRKRYDVTPFRPRPDTYYDATASPGQTIEHGGEFLQYFSGSSQTSTGRLRRTLGVASARSPGGPWRLSSTPLLPSSSAVENSALYYEPADGGWWWLLTNHISNASPAHTDGVWCYWSRMPTSFNVKQSGILIDGTVSSWAKTVIGMPSVIAVGDQLHVYYDGLEGSGVNHLGRDVGLVTIALPFIPPR